MPIVIKSKNFHKKASSISPFWLRFLAWIGGLQLIVIAALLAFTFYLGEQLIYQYPGFVKIAVSTVSKSLDELTAYRFSPLRILGYNPDFPVININIKQKNYRKLEHAAYQDKELDNKKRSAVTVNASISIEDKTIPIKIRLKKI